MPNSYDHSGGENEEYERAYETLAELIIEAIEANLRRTNGRETHGHALTEEEFLESLCKPPDGSKS